MSNYYFIFCKGALLLTADGRIPSGPEAPVALEPWQHLHHLPELDGHPCFTARIDAPIVGEGWQMTGLRETFDILPSPLYLMAGKAQEILYWDQTTKFCGVCGAPMKLHTDISKRCTRCGKEVWPALATAIIVAITRNEGHEILLVQSNKFKKDYLGLVAGFVETGETLEECLRREVREETNLRVRNIRYFASQPWPYPSGLMVGFTAEYESGTLQLQRSELTKGGWYSRDNLPAIPGPVSLARRLIDHWREPLDGEPDGGLSRLEFTTAASHSLA